MPIKYKLRSFWIDARNRFRYGAHAPRYAERIWIHPEQCKHYIEAADLVAHFGASVRQMSGRVVSTWPAALEQPFDNHSKLSYCWPHWLEGQSWTESGAIDFMMGKIAISPTGVTDKCRTLQDVEKRFDTLDAMWSEISARGSFPSRLEFIPDNFREVGGILMHLGPGGEPVFSGAGCHRFAMAMMLDTPFPAQLGIIHISALEHLPALRRPNQ